MKRILSIILVLTFMQSYGQKVTQSLGTKNTMVVALSDFKVDSLLFLPERDTTFTPSRNGAVVLKQSDSSLYYWAKYWRPMGGAYVKSVYKRNDSLFYQRGGSEYFVAKWGIRAFSVPTGLTATQVGDSISITTALNGLIIGNGTGFNTATVVAPLYFLDGRLWMARAGVDSSGYLSYADWQTFSAKIDPSRQVATSGSITGGGALTQDMVLTLVGDNPSPGAWQYYGTNGAGAKGFFSVPGYVDSVQSVFGRKGHIVPQESDYENFYAPKTHSHLGLIPIGGFTGQVLKKLSDNDYDVVWENDNNSGGSGGTGVDTLARMGDTLMFRKNLVDYFIPDAFKRRLYAPGNGISITQDSIIALKHITVTADSNILIGTAVNDGHKLKVNGPVRFDIGSDAQGDTYYRDGFGSLTRLPKPSGITNPVLSFDPFTVKPYWKQVDGVDSSVFATRYWTGTQYVPLAGYNKTNWDLAYSWGNHAGLYRPITYVPTWSEVTGKPTFSTVATSGSYNDLLNKPNIPTPIDTTSLSNRINGKQNIADTNTVDATRYWVLQNEIWKRNGINVYYPGTGHVGIGTATPTAGLEIKGSYNLTSEPSFKITDTSAGGHLSLGDATLVPGQFVPSILAKGYGTGQFDRNGLTVISEPGEDGTDDAAIELDGRGAGNTDLVNAHLLRVQNNDTTKFYITPSGGLNSQGITDSDTATIKPLGIATDGTFYKIPYWPGGGATNAFTSISQVNDSTFTLNRPNGTKDTVVISTGASTSGSTAYTFSSEFTNSSNSISVNTIAQSKITNLTSDLALKAPLASPALTGTPTAPTAAAGTNTTQIATTAFVSSALAGKQGTLTLTTTGTSGAATLVGNTLNIPNYATSGTGEANTASNLGSGTGIFAQKVDADLQFKSLVAGTNTTITSDANTVTVAIPGDLTTFTPRFSGGAGQGDVNISIPVGQLFVYLNTISVASNLTVGLSTSSTSGSQTLQHIIANTSTNATYNWQYSATVKKADGTVVTTIPNGKTHTLFYIPTGSYWLLASEY